VLCGLCCIADSACVCLCVCHNVCAFVCLCSTGNGCCSSSCRRLFPAFQTIRAISKVLSARVAEHMVEAGLGTMPEGCNDWQSFVAANMWTADDL